MVDDVRLIVIPPSEILAGGDAARVCRAVQAGGATSLQVRGKGEAAGPVLAVTRTLVASLTVPVYVNDRIDVALAAGAAGAHVGADDFAPERIRSVAPRPFRIGVSVGDDEEADRACRADADYWSVGPFFGTSSKSDAGAALGPAGFRRLAALAPPGVPVIAIGGIDASNVASVLGAGAAGIAVIGAVFGSDDVTASTRRLVDAMQRMG